MKSTGRHPVEALSAVQARNIKKPGKHVDGNGLYLVVGPSGAKRWILRTVVRGKRRDIGAMMVERAMARDCPRYSGERYADLEDERHDALPVAGFCEP